MRTRPDAYDVMSNQIPGRGEDTLASLFTPVCLALTAVIVGMSIIFGPRFPAVDAAFFEYYGRSIASGHRLYTDLWDNKLPSIYLINALWWKLFANDYFKHLLVEVAINCLTITIFAQILRRAKIVHWAMATLAFSIFYTFIGGPPNQTEHYATPLILLAIFASFYKRHATSGILLAIATTFFIPSFFAGSIPILITSTVRDRVKLLTAMIVALLLLTLAFIAYFGWQTGVELVQSWVAYEIGNYRHTNYQPQNHRYPIPQLSPAYYINTGFGVLLLGVATLWTRDISQRVRFGLFWTIATAVVVLALGKPTPHYFLPLYAPMIMLIASLPISRERVKRRWLVATATIALGIFTVTVHLDAFNATSEKTLMAIRYSGQKVFETYGTDAIAMLPWEAYLSSFAQPPSRFYLARVVKFAEEHDTWAHEPVAYVDDASYHFNRLPPPDTLRILCSDERTLPLRIYTQKKIRGLTCTRR